MNECEFWEDDYDYDDDFGYEVLYCPNCQLVCEHEVNPQSTICETCGFIMPIDPE